MTHEKANNPEHQRFRQLSDEFQALLMPIISKPDFETTQIDEDIYEAELSKTCKLVFFGPDPGAEDKGPSIVVQLGNLMSEPEDQELGGRIDGRFVSYNVSFSEDGSEVVSVEAFGNPFLERPDIGVTKTQNDRLGVINEVLATLSDNKASDVDDKLYKLIADKIPGYDPRRYELEYEQREGPTLYEKAIRAKDEETLAKINESVQSLREIHGFDMHDPGFVHAVVSEHLYGIDSELVLLNGEMPHGAKFFVNDFLTDFEGEDNYKDNPFYVFKSEGEDGSQRVGLILNDSIAGIIGRDAKNALPRIIDFSISHNGDVRLAIPGPGGDGVLLSSELAELFTGVTMVKSPQQLKTNVSQWIDKYKEEIDAPKIVEKKITQEEAFDIILNQKQIVEDIEEELLGANFKEIKEVNDYTYKMPSHHGKQVIIHSSNMFENDEEWNTDFSDASISIDVIDEAYGTHKRVTLLNAGSKEYETSDSIFVMGDTMRVAIQTILDQNAILPALGDRAEQDLRELDEALFHNLATGKVSPTFIAEGIAALRYSLGRSGVQPLRVRQRSVAGIEDHYATIVDSSIMTKQGQGSSLTLGRTTIFTKPNRAARTLETSVLISNPALGQNTVMNAGGSQEDLEKAALRSAGDADIIGRFTEEASRSNLSVQDLPLKDAAQTIKNLSVYLKRVPKYPRNGPISYFVRKG